MNALIAFLIASLASAGAVLLTQEQLTDIQLEGTAKTSQISGLNRSGTLKAAVTQWQLSTGSASVPTPEQLVAAGLLDPLFLASN